MQLRLAADAVVVTVETMGIRWKDFEVPIRDLWTVKVRRRIRDAHSGI